jgi:FAD/FMN-containing dehydrogenase
MTIIAELQALLGEAHVLEPAAGLERYTRDWSREIIGQPLAVVRPADTAEVAAVLRLCHASGVPVVAQGGNTGLVYGAIPSSDGREVVVSLERMNRIRAIDRVNFSLVAEAGCILQSVNDAAEAEDRFFPLSLGARGSCQIGGTISTNAGGINVLRWGMMRELVLGLEVVLPDGRIWNGLRQLRKDNTGYDLKQLFIGAEGTLGIVTAAALKLFPRPTLIETCLLAVPSAEAAMTLFAAARSDLSDLLSAFELLLRPCIDIVLRQQPAIHEPLATQAPAYVLLEASASGFVELRPLLERFLEQSMTVGLVLDGVVAESKAQAAALWRIREDLVEAQYQEAPRHLRTDISVPLSALPAFIAAADRALAEVMPGVKPIAYGHVGDGNVHYNVMPAPGTPEGEVAGVMKQCETLLYAIARKFEGSISAEHGIGRSKRTAFLDQLPAIDLMLMQMIKAGLDPDDLMAKSRLL